MRKLYFLAALGATTLFTACKSNFSEDPPLPHVYTPAIYISSQNQHVYAFDPVTGHKKCEFTTNGNVQSTPLVFNKAVYVIATNDASQTSTVYKLDHDSLKEIAHKDLPYQVLSSACGDNDKIYFGGADNNLHALDVNSLNEVWAVSTGGIVHSSPAVKDEKLIFGCYDGKVYAVNKNNGSSIWTYDATVVAPGVTFYSSPSVKGNTVYIGGSGTGVANSMFAIDIDGNFQWTFPTGSPIRSSPINYGGNVIFGSSDYNLYCVDSISGLKRWSVQMDDQVVSSPYASNQVIFVGCNDFNVYAIHIIDGAIKWKFKTGALVKSSPLVYNGRLYVGSYDKYLYTLDTASGNVIWKQNINGNIECSPVGYDPNANVAVHPSVSGMSKD